MKLIELPYFSHAVFDPLTITRIIVKIDAAKMVPTCGGRFLRPEGYVWYILINQGEERMQSNTSFTTLDAANIAFTEITGLVNSYR